MKSTSQTSKHRRYASIGITVAIVMMLVLSGPVGAVTLSIDGLTGTHTQGDSVIFNVTATINNPDTYVPIENFSLDITGATSKEVIFSTDGTILSGDPNITVTELTDPSANEYGYGNGYGYDSNVGYGYSFGFGYGYGYGYGSGVGGAVEYTYEITLDTSTLNTGNHDATLALNTGDSAKPSFESSSASFTIQDASTGGGGGDGTGSATVTGGESYDNILFKDTNRQTVSAGDDVRYEFGGKENPIQLVGFTPLTNAGNVFMTVEVLKDTSEFVDTPPTGTVYKNLNIWLGNAVKTGDITDATISFGVSKSWLKDNGFDPASIGLMRYTTGWTELPTTITGEDDDMVYYTAETPGYSIFSIVASEIAEIQDGADEIGEENIPSETTIPETEEDEGGLSGLPGFEAIFAIAGLLAVAYFVRRREFE